jgi:hypothetical protein
VRKYHGLHFFEEIKTMGIFDNVKSKTTKPAEAHMSLDVFSSLMRVPEGYYRLRKMTEFGMSPASLFVTVKDMELVPGHQVSVGFVLDGMDSNNSFGAPLFFSDLDHLDPLPGMEDLLKEAWLQPYLSEVMDLMKPEVGYLPLLRVFDALKTTPGSNIKIVCEAALQEHFTILAQNHVK